MVDIVEGDNGGWAIRIRGIVVAMLPKLEQAKPRAINLINRRIQTEIEIFNKDGKLIEKIR